MTPQKLSQCLAFLQGWPAGAGQEWNDFTLEMYTAVIGCWDDAFATRVFGEAFAAFGWRPFPSDLLALAVSIASPTPTSAEVYEEICDKAAHIGLYGSPDLYCPNWFNPGAPPMSHPLITQVVRYCGGWEMICSGEANMAQGLRKQVEEAHSQSLQSWNREVSRQIQLPALLRDQRYFPVYRPYRRLFSPEQKEVAK